MKFIVHNSVNNNSYPIACFESAGDLAFVPQASVNVMQDGVAFFVLSQRLDNEAKLALAAKLNERLKREFSQGIVAATSASSDCTSDRDFEPFFKGIKAIDPAIVTFEIGRRQASPSADHSFPDGLGFKKESILKVVKPAASDCAEPSEGWKAYRQRLRAIFTEVAKIA